MRPTTSRYSRSRRPPGPAADSGVVQGVSTFGRPGNRFAWQISLGDELPIVTVSDQVADGPLNGRRWGLGLWIPISIHMIEDFKDTSNPIVDTDYRFGFMVKFQERFNDIRMGMRFVPWNHESTHLGDEYTILASLDPLFERVNVSYENWDGFSVEGERLFTDGDNWKVRQGGRKPWGKDGYYLRSPARQRRATLTPSVANFEPSIGAEYRFSEWRGRQSYLSADARYQTVYTYHQSPENPEERQWSLNCADWPRGARKGRGACP